MRELKYMYYLPYNKIWKPFPGSCAIIPRWRNIASEKTSYRKFEGLHIQRKKSLSNYIVDFYCKPLKIIIELEGDSMQAVIQKIEAFVEEYKTKGTQ